MKKVVPTKRRKPNLAHNWLKENSASELLTSSPHGTTPSFTLLISVEEKPSSVSLVRTNTSVERILSNFLFISLGGMKVKADREESSPYAGKYCTHTLLSEFEIKLCWLPSTLSRD